MNYMKRNTRSLIFLGILFYAASLNAVCPLGSLTQISGSPFSTGNNPQGIAYSPVLPGGIVFAAVANESDGTVSVYQVNTTTGALTVVAGSPFLAGSGASWVAFSPFIYENLFAAVINFNANTVSIYQVNITTGVFTQIAGSPFAVGSFPNGVAYSPLVSGSLFLAVTNSGSNNVSVYQINAITGVPTQVTGSPFSTGTNPSLVAYSPIVAGNLFAAVANTGSNNVSVYTINTSTGVLTPVTGSPFSAGTAALGVTYSPLINNTLFAAVSNRNANTISVYQVNTSTGVLSQISGSPFGGGNSFQQISYSALLGNLLFIVAANLSGNSISMYQVNTSTGALTQVSNSPFATGTAPVGAAFSPLVSGGIFAAAVNSSSNTTSVFQVSNIIIPTITTLSQYILSGNSVTINGTISGGTAPYSIAWQDSFVQSGINTTTFSRTVSPTSSTIYYVATITDANGCSAGPSNTITIAVRTCP